MDSELNKNLQEQSSAQRDSAREGYENHADNNQRDYHGGGERTRRPRIQSQRIYSSNRPERLNQAGGSRPEGFGSNLQTNEEGGAQQRAYRPRFNQYGEQGGYRPRYRSEGYQPRQQGGYRPRYNNDGEGGHQPRQQGGYRPRYNNEGEGGYQPRQQGGYRPRYNNDGKGGYQPRQQGGYRPRYDDDGEGGYQPRQQGGCNRGGYGNRGRQQYGGYNNRGGYRQRTPDYDPNTKYSLKKRIEYSGQHVDPTVPVRLNRFLANAGVCSRREAGKFIQAGVVKVNGEVVTELGTKVMRTDEVVFHGQPVSLEKKVYVLLSKPKDYVTTSGDPQQRKTVMDLVKSMCPEHIYPVGRLDRNTTDVLLLTNDDDLASKLTHPKYLKKKVYHMFLDKNVTARDMQKIAEGIELEDEEMHADAIEYAHETDKNQVGIGIHSGKNRIVRRIFESLGYRVIKLDRVQFAGLTKKNLRRGGWRFLTEEEVNILRMGAFE